MIIVFKILFEIITRYNLLKKKQLKIRIRKMYKEYNNLNKLKKTSQL